MTILECASSNRAAGSEAPYDMRESVRSPACHCGPPQPEAERLLGRISHIVTVEPILRIARDSRFPEGPPRWKASHSTARVFSSATSPRQGCFRTDSRAAGICAYALALTRPPDLQ